MASNILGVLIAATIVCTAHGIIYLPGLNPNQYEDGVQVELKVNSLTSELTLFSHDYYTLAFPRPAEIHNAAENLGEQLTGETIQNSPYELLMRKNETCKVLRVGGEAYVIYEPAQVTQFADFIDEKFHVNWLVDNLPAASVDGRNYVHTKGFPVGERREDGRILFNHAKITIMYHRNPAAFEGSRIVGFFVQPISIDHKLDENTGELNTCDSKYGVSTGEAGSPNYEMYISGPKKRGQVRVMWTYDVFWVESPMRWSARWDFYLSMNTGSGVHWFSIINSTIIVLFLTGMTAMILLRALYKDLDRYNRVATDEEKAEDREDTGWKLVHSDVFRAPVKRPFLFAVLTGTGCQVLGMTLFTIFFAAIGFLSPANPGSLVIAILFSYLIMGVVAGFQSARTHKLFDGTQWQRCTLATATFFPAFVFGVVFLINIVVAAEHASNAIAFKNMVTVVFLWMLVSVPMVFVGAYYGFKRPKIELPVAVSPYPRPVPEQVWYLRTPIVMAVGGVLPFGCVFVEMFFILSSLWLGHVYYVYGFLLLVLLILVVTCAEIAIVLTYFQLCGENYHWWWRSMLVPGGCGVYVFLYSMYYFAVWSLIDNFASAMVYFGYMGLVSVVFALCTGTVGHVATFWFNVRIYGAVKVD